jgi:AcrR family transcriptional regulator
VYHFFKSKEELLEELIVDTTHKMESVAGALTPSPSIEESLSQFIDNYLHYLESEKRFLKLQLTLMLMPELKDVVSEPAKQRADLLLKMTTDWFTQASIMQPENKARLFLAMLDGIALHYLSIYDQYPLTSMKTQIKQAAYALCSIQNSGNINVRN